MKKRQMIQKIQMMGYGLQSTMNVSVEESVAMFLRVCGHNEVQRDIGLRFGRNQEIVMRKFGEVLRATELLAFDYIKTPTIQELHMIPQHLQADRRYWPFLVDLLGQWMAHICVKVKPGLQAMYWSRHDKTNFNVMAICDMNMLFTYVWNGAPGLCHDTRVLSLARNGDPQFPLPPGDKYYVVDSGYLNKQGFLAPYRSSRNRVVRYHLSQFINGPPPRNKEELFNRSHASICSVIEQTFRVWKKKWKIFRDDPRYGLEVQKSVIIATMGLHNFIRRSNFSDADFFEDYSEMHTENEENYSNEQEEAERPDRQYMTNIRENIANMLWDNFNNRF